MKRSEDYASLAPFYDALTGNVDYVHVHRFYTELFQKYGHTPRILLDLACGTGTLSFAFEKDGIEVIGADSSEQMLSAAMEKKFENGSQVLFLHQPAQRLDLYGTVDVTVCNLDAVNHFAPVYLPEIFRRVSLFMEPDGLFLFDVNSQYKFEYLLNNRCYSYDTGDVFCSWSSRYDGKSQADIQLELFEYQGDGQYTRQTEHIREFFYSDETLTRLLDKNGFDLLERLADYTQTPPEETSQRIHYIARKRGSRNE